MSLDLTACPRCSSPLVKGFVNAGKGPLRWDTDEPSTTIAGGDLLLDQAMVWGRQRTPGQRCRQCHLVLFESTPGAQRRAFTSLR
jgi:hypothetical protein